MSHTCPSCGEKFDTEGGMKKHHYYVHDESIAKETSDCSSCGSTFEYYPSNKDGVFCADCVDPEQSWHNPNPRYGKDNHNYNSVSLNCDNCGSEIEVQESNLSEKNYCNIRCYAEHRSEFQKGESNPNYKEGNYRKSEFYQGDWERVKRECKLRDEERCQVCGDESGVIDVHHIKPVRTFDDPDDAHTLDNVVCLCRSCHISIDHGDEELPKDLSTCKQ